MVGLTGPPGVGKSTLIARLIEVLRAEDQSVGVIAIDPSSRQSGGALLGDRVPLALDAEDAGVFVRSMAERGQVAAFLPVPCRRRLAWPAASLWPMRSRTPSPEARKP